MLFATRPRLFHSRLLALLVVIGGLASGCQSSRRSFSFQPMPGRVQAVKAAAAAAATPEAAAAPLAVTAAKTAAQPILALPAAREYRRALPQPEPLMASTKTADIATLPMVRPAATHRRPLLARAHAPAEAGLGTTVLGVLGLVVLPIALLGLLLSGGGLVWGIVAGAAALAVLVAYIDPFGRR
ncbi:hypothetical protein [Hymenobacter siberiensis]|jgi:hypothetical protein|uniref:hypothetical protein n=1 Tax=Hymenobacter siberiensis TaxID=2848396 RepID=UPI001C1E2FB2|nr:hypothetical protein [Hymenobacter siberiensis]MBU6120393.1 hypothetical protein [Hymenobacter siberiensis]